MANREDLSFGLGEDWRFIYECYKNDKVTKLDITGASFLVTVETPDGVTQYASADHPSFFQILVDTPYSYRVYVAIPPANQTPPGAGNHKYNLRVILPTGVKDDQLYGSLAIRNVAT